MGLWMVVGISFGVKVGFRWGSVLCLLLFRKVVQVAEIGVELGQKLLEWRSGNGNRVWGLMLQRY